MQFQALDQQRPNIGQLATNTLSRVKSCCSVLRDGDAPSETSWTFPPQSNFDRLMPLHRVEKEMKGLRVKTLRTHQP